MIARPVTDAVPPGFTVQLGDRVHLCDDGRALVGASSVLYLRPEAAERWGSDRRLAVRTAADAALARLLLDRGMADPVWHHRPRAEAAVGRVTVVVPVRDRDDQLDQLLGVLAAARLDVVVVDDGSRDPEGAARVVRTHGARLVVHPRNRGPAAARNTGLAHVDTEFVAFCDSDVLPDADCLAVLLRHLDDPAVAVVAPRVLGVPPRPDDGWIERYEQARSSLDLGAHPGAVGPQRPVSYLPSAFLLARRSALGTGFDEALRCGEDVDLIWRLVDAGWRVRYEPAATVRHRHRTVLREWLQRKAFYGTSAAPLASRHGRAVAPAVLTGWSAAVSVALLAQRRWSVPVAAAAWAWTTVSVARRLRRSAHPLRTAAVLTTEGLVATMWQTASALTRHYWPIALTTAVVSPRGRRALLAAAVAEAVADRHRTGADLDPVRYLLARRLDDAAYGAGLWWGAIRAHSAEALMPDVRHRAR